MPSGNRWSWHTEAFATPHTAQWCFAWWRYDLHNSFLSWIPPAPHQNYQHLPKHLIFYDAEFSERSCWCKAVELFLSSLSACQGRISLVILQSHPFSSLQGSFLESIQPSTAILDQMYKNHGSGYQVKFSVKRIRCVDCYEVSRAYGFDSPVFWFRL